MPDGPYPQTERHWRALLAAAANPTEAQKKKIEGRWQMKLDDFLADIESRNDEFHKKQGAQENG